MYRSAIMAIALLTAPQVAIAQTAPTYAEVADGFFRTLQAGDTAKAYKDIWGGTLMDKKQGEVENLVLQTATTLKTYGKVVGWELVSEKIISASYIERVYLVRTEGLPIFFKMYFYRPSSKWLVTNLYFTDTYKNVQ